VRDYVKKGAQLFIEGKIQNRSWDDKQTGEKKYRTEIIINELSLLGGAERSTTAKAQSTRSDYADTGITDDDIPF